jgi:hypothetical protein
MKRVWDKRLRARWRVQSHSAVSRLGDLDLVAPHSSAREPYLRVGLFAPTRVRRVGPSDFSDGAPPNDTAQGASFAPSERTRSAWPGVRETREPSPPAFGTGRHRPAGKMGAPQRADVNAGEHGERQFESRSGHHGASSRPLPARGSSAADDWRGRTGRLEIERNQDDLELALHTCWTVNGEYPTGRVRCTRPVRFTTCGEIPGPGLDQQTRAESFRPSTSSRGRE